LNSYFGFFWLLLGGFCYGAFFSFFLVGVLVVRGELSFVPDSTRMRSSHALYPPRGLRQFSLAAGHHCRSSTSRFFLDGHFL